MVELPSALQRRRSFIAPYWDLLKSNHVNVLLIFVPMGIAAGYLELNALAVFSLNFLAIVPLAAVLSDTTEILASMTGDTLGGLLNATFGNVVELIVALAALYRGEIRIVQTSMLGSILSNLILVLGCAFVAGGYNRLQQSFSQTAAQTMSSMMGLSCISLVIPATFSATVPSEDKCLVVSLSRWTSVVLLIVYGLYLLFQLKTHTVFFESAEEEEEAAPDAALSRNECLVLLAIVTLVVAASAEYLVGSIEAVVDSTPLSKSFIGLILLPIVGNAAEHVTAVFMAMKNKLDLTMNVAVGSSMQIALFLTPFLVIWGWVIDQPMSLYFHTFESILLFVSVYLAGMVLEDGESNWLEGALLIALYAIIAIAYLFYPDEVATQDVHLQNLIAKVINSN
nr:Vcx1 [Starmerella bombicola]